MHDPFKKNIRGNGLSFLFVYGKKYLLPNYVWTYFNRNNQTFTKIKKYFKRIFFKTENWFLSF
jgi:CRISPR/Cas system CSM-associated protein Csm4 (group 5 of RAMP superfamily)